MSKTICFDFDQEAGNMKFQLNVLESTGIGKNHRYEKVDQSPILETEDMEGLKEFLRKLNDYLDLVKMDLEILESTFNGGIDNE